MLTGSRTCSGKGGATSRFDVGFAAKCAELLFKFGLRTQERRAGKEVISCLSKLISSARKKEELKRGEVPPMGSHPWLQDWMIRGKGGNLAIFTLMLAANGAMPSFQLRQLVIVLRQLSVVAGSKLFAEWLQTVLIAWDKNKAGVKKKFYEELMDSVNTNDRKNNFKMLVKRFCGGKKKGRK